MPQHTADLMMPADLADILVSERLARLTLERRSATLQILAEAASGASVAISLLQGPSTVVQVAHGIKRWTREHRKSTPGSDRLTIVPSGRREVRIIDNDTDIAIIIEILQYAMIPEDDPQPPEDLDGLTI